MTSGIELIKKLARTFGPTGCEGNVEEAIREELAESRAELFTDRMGNLVAHLKGKEGAPRVMLSAHMDEVGFMVTEILDDGTLHFDTVGGIDVRVMCGRPVLMGNEHKKVPGVLTAKGIHLQDAEERKKLPKISDMYIDVGTSSREETEKLLSLGDFGTFDTDFFTFGKDDAYFACKALDDRVGCAVLIELLRALESSPVPPSLDLYFAFTVREEIGISGATVTANRIAPDIAFVLETTAMADIADVPPEKRVADIGKGGVLSLLDRSTIYDRALIDRVLSVAEREKIPVQVKRYVSGGNDAGNIQRTGSGVRCLALSAPTRYLHAPISVGACADVTAMIALLGAVLGELGKEGK
ncbi:MAG: M42 family metallopeptidase [Ruminococcaceae bacterium]|nr:M42 family metallopeptidase [Oscillospiraceae bacterium]